MAVSEIGRYEILETLGRGAMGVVYLARDPIIDRQLALKTLRLDLDTELADEFRERFVREARAAGRLSHPSIVTIHDVGEDQASGVLFIAMEYIRGSDLKQLLAAGHCFAPAEAARIAADVAGALDYAHSMGVVHRDIKPANIILTEGGKAKIMDFGVARLESSNLTVEGQFIGTPNYMSPEQITGRTVDGRSDLFSLGVVVYNLLTGDRPFAGDTMHEVTRRIVDQACPIPSTVRAGIPPAFNPIVLKCLEKDPERRFQTGGELARVLEALARALPNQEGARAELVAAVEADLGTRVRAEAPTEAPDEAPHARSLTPRTAAIRRPPPESRYTRWVRRLPVPALLLREVVPRWALAISLGAGLACALTIATLLALTDHGPFPAPSASSTLNLHRVAGQLRGASAQLAADRFAEAESGLLAVLDQAPASLEARRLLGLLNERLAAERTSVETAERLAALIAEGRRLYRNGAWGEAAETFRQALELDPASELAASYLELAEERGQRSQRPVRRTTSPPQPRVTPRRATTAPTPTPGTARITLFFNSPLNAGTIEIMLDGEPLAEVPFDFTRKGFLGWRKKKGTGAVKRVLIASSGRHTLGVTLRDAERGVLGSATLPRDLPAGSDWSLRVDLPEAGGRPSFFLVQAN